MTSKKQKENEFRQELIFDFTIFYPNISMPLSFPIHTKGHTAAI
ncbi:hypothetical protein HMPREF9372_2381 [Sporosarcina newyorkensis 2681]|uniref:Uncharacterized protein n=1 Tax=Sporosarcina newyorkensis 2681 TaxID=1027292 RepID=F9DUA0_9BACL|nr:hypothetical protein HMPREF9372_2381 [Sporosarcina newyorkensis 2681]